ncbi:hypothetical protein HanIR_Chr04g0163631 [Helianthus annuus]|nr:hypothetical protein HanIR_Chr04g0163631 [Helianthus annuus]
MYMQYLRVFLLFYTWFTCDHIYDYVFVVVKNIGGCHHCRPDCSRTPITMG